MSGVRSEVRRQRRFGKLASVSAVATLSTLTLAAGPAAAAHYYGIAYVDGRKFLGLSGSIVSDALDTPNNSAYFVNNDMWILNPYSSPVHWIEAGIIIGTVCTSGAGGGSPCHEVGSYDKHRFFWGDSRYGDGYHLHIDVSDVASMRTFYTDQIWYLGNYQWQAYVGGWSGTSTSNSLSGQELESGTEETTQSATACSATRDLG